MTKNKWTIILCTLTLALTLSSKANAQLNQERIWGRDRYETSIEVSKNGWSSGSEYVILASGENFPDALSATPLAKKYNAPVLLNPNGFLDSRVQDELQRLCVKKVFIIGGEGVIPENVKKEIEDKNMVVERLAGQNRYETAVKVAEKVGFNGEIFLVNGENFPDALSVSPIAAQKSAPILLTPQSGMPKAVEEYVKGKNITKSYIIGQDDVISKDVTSMIPNEERISGNSKYDTNVEVLKRFKDMIKEDNLYVASGKNFPDALSGSALAAKNSSAVMLLDEDSGENTDKYILDKKMNLPKITILGGNGSLADELINSTLYPEKYNGQKLKFILDREMLLKVDSKTGERVQICKERVAKYKVYNNYIYIETIPGVKASYSDKDKMQLYRMNLDGKGKVHIADLNSYGYEYGFQYISTCDLFDVYDNHIYYASYEGSICKTDLDGGEKIELKAYGKETNSLVPLAFKAQGEYLYFNLLYPCDECIQKEFRIKFDGTGLEQLY